MGKVVEQAADLLRGNEIRVVVGAGPIEIDRVTQEPRDGPI
ncbi:hypothetical protein SK803_40495 [Lentzea sp. BCCO 10_0856]|uniref:Uncharacterized protein n=1 Tax=Lentzea miocenica TaxID=3095431 RepID=A0ABU4TE91_9PSEU|nr:hypothetical protein [Lentzea sp. BCCO 10_0856]MDX8036512.1 hypothetical protein [Lentzea sp. BCCO 10_0856]